ncbi:MAG: hypothetical protein M9947_06565 [Thermomicrobiales bacterium]|nr:hypothetical protein [Thermomicrobiales bacterium]
MSSSLQMVVEQPLRFSTAAYQTNPADTAGRSAVLLREISLLDSGSTPLPATIMAVATDHTEGNGNDRAQRVLDRFQSAVVDGTQTDMAARLKAAFRAANADLYAADPGEVSLVALVARGKYASFAVVGDNQAFLYRADRINQVTKNQRTERSNNRRTEKRTLETKTAPQLLGVEERLENRLPAIFDITLLPLDSVALLSGTTAEQIAAGSTTKALVPAGQSFSGMIEQRVSNAGDITSAATVLDVLPAREAMPEPPQEALSTPTSLPYIIIALIFLAGLLLALWYFFL